MTRFALLLFSIATILTAQFTPKFDVASVKPSKSDDPPSSNFPMGPGNAYTPNGGHFTARNVLLVTYIAFAYKVVGEQARSLLTSLPGWATSEKFDIVAQTDGDPAKDTKDQMRLMMRSLLAERFSMVARYETRQVPVFALTLVKAGKFGSGLQRHPGDSPCSTVPTANNPGPAATVAGGFPTLCGGFVTMPSGGPGRSRIGARSVTMPFIANGLSVFGNLGRPVVDQTGLNGTFDMVVEWVPEANGPAPPDGDAVPPEASGPTFFEALKEQLGLRLDSQKGHRISWSSIISNIRRATDSFTDHPPRSGSVWNITTSLAGIANRLTDLR